MIIGMQIFSMVIYAKIFLIGIMNLTNEEGRRYHDDSQVFPALWAIPVIAHPRKDDETSTAPRPYKVPLQQYLVV